MRVPESFLQKARASRTPFYLIFLRDLFFCNLRLPFFFFRGYLVGLSNLGELGAILHESLSLHATLTSCNRLSRPALIARVTLIDHTLRGECVFLTRRTTDDDFPVSSGSSRFITSLSVTGNRERQMPDINFGRIDSIRGARPNNRPRAGARALKLFPQYYRCIVPIGLLSKFVL